MNTLFQDRKICVLIPTYNNHKTLKRVIDGVLQFTNQIIIINDGSTDSTKEILDTYSDSLAVLHLPQNKGKGNALKVGFKEAIKIGYEYALTIDSDGQHYPDDIPNFLSELEKTEQPILLIGSRNMTHESVPKKSSFGNKFSNFWFWFETGITLSDTQSGYRLYPLQYIPKKYFTTKFEFEIEIIVRTAWKGVEVKNVPIKVLYDPLERVSHFRPFQDFTRISILNTVLVTITLLYIKPRDFFRSFKKKSFKQFFFEDILESKDSIKTKSLSIALGTFIGIAPLWGLQTFLSIFLAVVLKLNKSLSFAFSNVSIPPMIPFIVYASLQLGGFVLNKDVVFNFSKDINFEEVKNQLVIYIVGSLLLATFVATLFGVISFIALNYFKKKNLKNA